MGVKFELENIFSISDFRSMLNEAQSIAETADVLILKNSRPNYVFMNFKRYKKLMELIEEIKESI